jgi:hypothetical protein
MKTRPSQQFCYCYVVSPGHLSQHAKAATAEGLTFSDPMHKKVREIQICTIFVIHEKNYHPLAFMPF